MIAITFALPNESRGLSERLRDEIESGAVCIFHTGVGPERAQATIGSLFAENAPTLVISAGFAGALHNGVRVGDLIFGANHSDPELVERAEKQLSDVRRANLVTARVIVDTPAERSELANNRGADVADMETEVIAAACAGRGVPMLSLRVVSDSADEPFPAPAAVLFDVERQRTNAIRLTTYLLRHPQRLVHLISFGRRVAKVRSRLVNSVADLTRQLIASPPYGPR